MKNYVQQNEVTSLIKRGSFIDLASCANQYLQKDFIYKMLFPIFLQTPL
jgi:hypothetical protein